MSKCIGCEDSTSFEVLSDGTVFLRLVRDNIETVEQTSLQELGLSGSLGGLGLHRAMQPRLRELRKKRDASDRA